MTKTSLAARWGCDKRTLYRWEKTGAPLHDEAQMATWLSSRKHLPAGTRAALAVMGSAGGPASAGGGIGSLNDRGGGEFSTPSASQGAAAALRRLEAQERLAHDAFQQADKAWERLTAKALEAPESEKAAALAAKAAALANLRIAREGWLKLLESLRRYDSQVEQARRDSGETLSRNEVEQLLAKCVVWWLHGINSAAEDLAPRLVRLDFVEEVWARIHPWFVARWGEAFLEGARRSAKMSLPKWAAECVRAELAKSLRIPDKTKRRPAPEVLA